MCAGLLERTTEELIRDTVLPGDPDLFLWFVLRHVSTREVAEDRHQKKQLSGAFVTYGRPDPYRSSDLSRRIYVSVRTLMFLGITNHVACHKVTDHVERWIGRSKRGRPSKRKRDLCSKIETVRALFNRQKSRHPFRERLPRLDSEVQEFWYGFLWFRPWAMDLLELAEREAEQAGLPLLTYLAEWKRSSSPERRLQGEVAEQVANFKMRVAAPESLPSNKNRSSFGLILSASRQRSQRPKSSRGLRPPR